MEPTNRRRIVRALEVTIGSGRPFSSYGPGVDTYAPAAVAQIGLRWPRDVLTRRIAERVEEMFAAGFVDEVRATAAPAGFSRTARQALGYREILDALEGGCASSMRRSPRSSPAPANSPSARSDGSAGTHAYAGSTSSTTPWPRPLPAVIAAFDT